MGQIKTVILESQVERPPFNHRFGVTKKSRSVLIEYRNVGVELKTRDFLRCARTLQQLRREQIAAFVCDPNAHWEAVNFSGLTSEFPGQGKIRLQRLSDGNYAVCYRCVRVILSPQEGEVIRQHTLDSPPPTIGRFAKIKRWFARRPGVDNPLLRERFCVDLSENIHVHFQNLRLEFSKEEFLLLWDAVSGLNITHWRRLPQGEVASARLPAATEWDDRVQLEEQVEGHFHLHYRNLRVEFRSFTEIGLRFRNGAIYDIDQDYAGRFIESNNWKLLGVRSEQIGELKVIVYDKTGHNVVPIEESPIYRALKENNRRVYDDYATIVRTHDPQCRNCWDRFQTLYAAIRDEGVQPNSVVVIRGQGKVVFDGQHRACILRHLFGAEARVKVVHYELPPGELQLYRERLS